MSEYEGYVPGTPELRAAASRHRAERDALVRKLRTLATLLDEGGMSIGEARDWCHNLGMQD